MLFLFLLHVVLVDYSDGLPFTSNDLTYNHPLQVDTKREDVRIKDMLVHRLILNKIDKNDFFRHCAIVYEDFYAPKTVCSKDVYRNKVKDYYDFYGKTSIDKIPDKTFYVSYLKFNKALKNWIYSYNYEIFWDTKKDILLYSVVETRSLRKKRSQGFRIPYLFQLLIKAFLFSEKKKVKELIKTHYNKYFPYYDVFETHCKTWGNDKLFDKLKESQQFEKKETYLHLTLFRDDLNMLSVVMDKNIRSFAFIIKKVELLK